MIGLKSNDKSIEKSIAFFQGAPDNELWRKYSNKIFISFKLIREKKENEQNQPLKKFYSQKNQTNNTSNLERTKNCNDSFFDALINEKSKRVFDPIYFPVKIFAEFESHRTEKEEKFFSNSTKTEATAGKRRRRRRFTSDEERKVARILKNRRTAEESRQRRIQKMKDLENFAANSEEREKKLREQIHYLGKQNASQEIELLLLNRRLYEKL